MNDLLKTMPASSPLRYEKGAQAFCENKQTACSDDRIETAREKGILTDTDMFILQTVLDYGVVSRNAVTSYLTGLTSMPDSLKKPDYSRNFHNLVEHGLLLRYSIRAGDRGLPCLYTLSKGAAHYLKRTIGRGYRKSYGISSIDITGDVAGALRKAAFNQFYMRLMVSGSLILESHTDIRIRYKGASYRFDGEAKIAHLTERESPYEFVFLCLRNFPGWQGYYHGAVQAFQAKESGRYLLPNIIVLCESHMMAAEAEKERSRWTESDRAVSCYYLPDIMAVEPFRAVYRVTLNGDSYDFAEVGLSIKKCAKTG